MLFEWYCCICKSVVKRGLFTISGENAENKGFFFYNFKIFKFYIGITIYLIKFLLIKIFIKYIVIYIYKKIMMRILVIIMMMIILLKKKNYKM